MNKFLCLLLCLFGCFDTSAQYRNFRMVPGLRIPADSQVFKTLLTSLDQFLEQKEGPNSTNSFVYAAELPATSLLLDEMKGLSNDERVSSLYTGAWLASVVPLGKSNFRLQVLYGRFASDTPALRAAFSLLALPEKGRFHFAAPLKRNTAGWKRITKGGVTFCYSDSVSSKGMAEYGTLNETFLAKLGLKKHTVIYCCTDFPQVLSLVGVDYKQEYNGMARNSLSSSERDTLLSLNGTFTPAFSGFDPHDMWHEKLHLLLPADSVNRPVDEGCAYLYGGSWGLNWEDVKTLFHAFRQQHPGADWLQLYLDGTDFREGNEPLKISYFLNALVVQQLEREQGFGAVIQLLRCGKKQQGDANYFTRLRQLTGVGKEEFNAYIGRQLKKL